MGRNEQIRNPNINGNFFIEFSFEKFLLWSAPPLCGAGAVFLRV
jgi:hypothetical protein